MNEGSQTDVPGIVLVDFVLAPLSTGWKSLIRPDVPKLVVKIVPHLVACFFRGRFRLRMARCQIYGGALQLSAVILQV